MYYITIAILVTLYLLFGFFLGVFKMISEYDYVKLHLPTNSDKIFTSIIVMIFWPVLLTIVFLS